MRNGTSYFQHSFVQSTENERDWRCVSFIRLHPSPFTLNPNKINAINQSAGRFHCSSQPHLDRLPVQRTIRRWRCMGWLCTRIATGVVVWSSYRSIRHPVARISIICSVSGGGAGGVCGAVTIGAESSDGSEVETEKR